MTSGGRLLLSESVLWGNQAVHLPNQTDPRGGGFLHFGTAHFARSSIVYNTSGAHGGGMFFEASNGEYSLENVTISHDQAAGEGGGIYSWPTWYARNVTATENRAKAAGGISSIGRNFDEWGLEARFENSIIAGNKAGHRGHRPGRGHRFNCHHGRAVPEPTLALLQLAALATAFGVARIDRA